MFVSWNVFVGDLETNLGCVIEHQPMFDSVWVPLMQRGRSREWWHDYDEFGAVICWVKRGWCGITCRWMFLNISLKQWWWLRQRSCIRKFLCACSRFEISHYGPATEDRSFRPHSETKQRRKKCRSWSCPVCSLHGTQRSRWLCPVFPGQHDARQLEVDDTARTVDEVRYPRCRRSGTNHAYCWRISSWRSEWCRGESTLNCSTWAG